MNTRREYGIIIPNRYPELALDFIASIKRTHAELPPILVVRDRNTQEYGNDAFVTDGPEPFSFTKNVNIGFKFFTNMDCFVCNDDLECVEKDFFPRLYSIMCLFPKCGLISPLIEGGVGNPMQSYHSRARLWEGFPNEVALKDSTVCFPCVLISGQLINSIGNLDENLTGYGLDDDDYCIRARKAGLWTMITKQLRIKHGNGGPGTNRGYNYSLSFVRETVMPSDLPYLTTKHSQDKKSA